MESKTLEVVVKAVIDCDRRRVADAVQQALKDGLDPIDILERGLAKGALEVGDRFERGEAFLTDLVMSGEAMKDGMKLITARLEEKKQAMPYAGRYTIGTAEGDIHDLGKNIVKTMLEVSGFEVTDLGVDTSPARFVENVAKLMPHIIGVSALLTVSLEGQKKVVEALRSAGLREKVKVMIGGAPVTEEWSREIGADGCGENAVTAVKIAKQLISKEDMKAI